MYEHTYNIINQLSHSYAFVARLSLFRQHLLHLRNIGSHYVKPWKTSFALLVNIFSPLQYNRELTKSANKTYVRFINGYTIIGHCSVQWCFCSPARIRTGGRMNFANIYDGMPKSSLWRTASVSCLVASRHGNNQLYSFLFTARPQGVADVEDCSCEFGLFTMATFGIWLASPVAVGPTSQTYSWSSQTRTSTLISDCRCWRRHDNDIPLARMENEAPREQKQWYARNNYAP